MNQHSALLTDLSERYRSYTPRDPMPDVLQYDRDLEWPFESLAKSALFAEKKFEVPELPKIRNKIGRSESALRNISELAHLLYGRGVPCDVLAQYLADSISFAEGVRDCLVRFRHQNSDPHVSSSTSWVYRINTPFQDFRFITILLLLVTDADVVSRWLSMVYRTDNARSYITDLLVRSFCADWDVAKKYRKLDRYDHPRILNALHKALSAPNPAGRQAGITQYMAGWNRMMKPYGWKPERHYTAWPDRNQPRPPGSDDSFHYFAYEAALAVCAWDLDDSAFREHPYYPRDLVDYYRAHVRHTRDAWRAEGAGPGLAVAPLPAPKRIDLAKGKSKGYKRWLELACDGDKEAVQAILEEGGRLRSLKERWDEALSALADAGHAVRADLKDADSLQGQIDELAANRQLADFEPPAEPRAGPARCEMLMQEAPQWAAAQGYTWHALDDGGDNWQAVLIRNAFDAEWLELGTSLRLPQELLGPSPS